MIYLIAAFTIFICLFILFTLSRNDFVLMRKNISPTAIFDAIGIGLIISFFIGRLVYIIDSGKYMLLYPLSFFHIIKYPGISTLGIFLGIFLALLAFRKKKAVLRLSDILSLSFFPVLFASILTQNIYAPFIIVKVLVGIVACFFFAILVRFHKNYTIHDGTITCGVLLMLSLNTFLVQLHITHHTFIALFSFTQWISVILGIFSLAAISVNEKLLKRK